MPNPEAQLQPIEIPPGVTPSTDDTAFAAQNWTSSVGIRFRNGKPEKKGGYTAVQLSEAIGGVPRSVYSTEINGIDYTMVGTNTRLYVLVGGIVTNITPFQTMATAASASLSTTFGTLASNPISTVIGTNIVTVQDANASRYQINDEIKYSGATAVGGITTGQINATQIIRSIGSGSYTFWASTNATSTATGGGASVVAASGLMRCTVANTLASGDRVNIAGAATTGGITNTLINAEFITRNNTASYFDFVTMGFATSTVTAAGGTGTEFYPPILAGLADESSGIGYGEGEYGVGLYGTPLSSGTSREYPQIWFFDRFGDFIMMTPGNQGALYEWAGSIETAPVITANSPANINYMFVASNTIIVFGNGGNENRITACDQGNRTVWSGTAQNQFFDAVESGAGRFIGAIKLSSINLIFTEKQVYTFQQIGLPNVWAISFLASEGMISALAGFQVNGTAYWMGLNNFYTWNGGAVSVMTSNIYPKSTSLGFGGASPSTILKYVFKNINEGQKSKCFCWFNVLYQELRWHYPSQAANDPDSVAAVNLLDNSWWPDQESRIAAELPTALGTYPLLSDVSGNVYQHEDGTDNVNAPLAFSLTSPIRTVGKNEVLLSAFIPDSIQSGGAINVQITAQQWPNSATSRSQQTYSVPVGAGRQTFGQQGRFWQYGISGSVLGQAWRMGKWGEELQQASDGA